MRSAALHVIERAAHPTLTELERADFEERFSLGDYTSAGFEDDEQARAALCKRWIQAGSL